VAGTQWDRLGQKEAVFEIVAPAVRKVAAETGVKLQEFFRDDPIWRLSWARRQGGEAAVDVEWTDEEPDTYWVSAQCWIDDYDSAMRRRRLEEVGEFSRDQPLEQLEGLLRKAVETVDGWGDADLDEESGPFPDWQKYSTREEFYRTRLPRR
jgi:hypothetical protein